MVNIRIKLRKVHHIQLPRFFKNPIQFDNKQVHTRLAVSRYLHSCLLSFLLADLAISMLCIAYASAYANKELKQARTATSLRGYLYGGGPALLVGLALFAEIPRLS